MCICRVLSSISTCKRLNVLSVLEIHINKVSSEQSVLDPLIGGDRSVKCKKELLFTQEQRKQGRFVTSSMFM